MVKLYMLVEKKKKALLTVRINFDKIAKTF